MSDLELLVRSGALLITLITLAVGSIIWLIRLEAGHMALKERFKEHKLELDKYKEDAKENESKIWDKIDAIKEQNNKILQMISRLEGKFETRKGVQGYEKN